MTIEKIDVLVIAALDIEYKAFKAAAERISHFEKTTWTEKNRGQSGQYEVARIRSKRGGSLLIAIARPTRMGGGATSPLAASLVERLKPGCLAMCGVCAGNPNNTSLGDVIIADMVYAYDEGKRTVIGTEFDHRQYPMSDIWVRAAQDFDPKFLPSWGKASTREADFWLLEQIHRGADPSRHPAQSRFFPPPLGNLRLRGWKLID